MGTAKALTGNGGAFLFWWAMKKREIKSHKGGRTERIYIRATPEIRRKAAELAKQKGCSVADLFEEWVNKESLTTQ